MKPLLSVTLGAALAAAAAAAAGCDGGGKHGGTSSVEIIHWWTAEGEKEAVDALLGVFQEQHPSEPITNTAVMGSTAARMTIEERMIGGQPPDTFQANGGWDLLAWVVYNNIDDSASKMDPIDDTAVAEDWAAFMPSAVLGTVSFKDHLTGKPHIYAVPLNIHRLNTMFFNEKLFASIGLAMPATLDDVFAAAQTFKAMGVLSPLALGTKDGTLPLLFFENLLVARAGGAFYQDFMHGLGDPFGPEIAAAVDDLATFFSFSNPNASSLTWSQAADRVLTGDAALTLMGDWAKGYMVSRQATPDVDFGAVPTPGTSGTFVFTTDTFGLPIGAPNQPGALDLLRVFGSKDGQDTFNPIKGSISARSDSDTTKYDDMAKRTIAEFQQASQDEAIYPATAILAPPDFLTNVDAALRLFLQNGDKSALIHTIANYYDILQNSVLR
jgi:glucose/mannose transport system substrate-binding protein